MTADVLRAMVEAAGPAPSLTEVRVAGVLWTMDWREAQTPLLVLE